MVSSGFGSPGLLEDLRVGRGDGAGSIYTGNTMPPGLENGWSAYTLACALLVSWVVGYNYRGVWEGYMSSDIWELKIGDRIRME